MVFEKSHLKDILIRSLLLFSFVFVSFSSDFCFGQNKSSYRTVPDSLFVFVNKNIRTPEFTKVEKYLPPNYVTNASVDYTAYIQKAIDENKRLIMPDFPILINTKGLKLRNDQDILFQNNSLLKIEPNNLTHYNIIDIRDVQNVTLYNPKLEGDKYTHKGNKGEWGMGINISGGIDITIINPIIKKCWGDGIYIGKSGSRVSKNITISGGWIDDNRRNGISVISVESLSITNLVISNTFGTLPMAGIDFEPNKNSEELKDIHLDKVTSYNNEKTGFLIYLGSMLGKESKNINLSINNSRDYYSKYAISVPGLKKAYDSSIKRIQGNVQFNNFRGFDNTEFFAKGTGEYIYTPNIELNNIAINKKKTRNLKLESDYNKWFKNKGFSIK
ncbi:Right handed beta helix region [Porphyromonadaceae bacterium NLAE-zl-C104]|nr:Right handed beta helix region [Porphyromonadaceae bacterium NLAE-zl-C104]